MASHSAMSASIAVHFTTRSIDEPASASAARMFSSVCRVSLRRQAILRHDIEHPVVNDPEMKIWSEYAVRAWPTMMLIDPRGKVIGSHSGEGVFEVFDPVISQMAEHFAGEGSLDRRPLAPVLEREREHGTRHVLVEARQLGSRLGVLAFRHRAGGLAR